MKMLGTKNPAHKLTVREVREIRRQWKTGKSGPEIAFTFKITKAHVSRIVLRRCWRDV